MPAEEGRLLVLYGYRSWGCDGWQESRSLSSSNGRRATSAALADGSPVRGSCVESRAAGGSASSTTPDATSFAGTAIASPMRASARTVGAGTQAGKTSSGGGLDASPVGIPTSDPAKGQVAADL
jgi:hypothetical protein